MNTLQKLLSYFNAGQAGLVLTSFEPEEVHKELAEQARQSRATDNKIDLMFWDAADALTDAYGNPVSFKPQNDDDDISALVGASSKPQKIGLHDTLEAVIQTIRGRQYRAETDQKTADDDALRVLIVRNADRHLTPNGPNGPVDTVLLAQCQKIVNEGQSCHVFMILQTCPSFELPDELMVHFEYVHHDLPSTEERAQILMDLDIKDIPALAMNATAGLSRAKTAQYAAETISQYGYLNPAAVFQKKATHLSRASKLDVWSPEFVQQIKLWPRPEALPDNLRNASDITLVAEENSASNKKLKDGEVRVKIRATCDGKTVSHWLDAMPLAKFDQNFRPERDFYSLKSVVGLTGLKDFLRKGFRPGVPERAKMKHVLMLGVPGTGKSFTMQCCSGEFNAPLSSMQASNLYSKWLGDTDKILAKMLETVGMIGGILAIDEFQRFLPQGGPGGESGGVENRLLGTLLTWFNNQQSNLVLSAANNIANLPDEITRSGRVDALMFVGFPGREAKDAAWRMYLNRHQLQDIEMPKDEYWTPADIMSCCRLAEQQGVSVVHASRWITPSYEKNPKQMDSLMEWAEAAGCICAETGERFRHPKNTPQVTTASKVTRKIKKSAENNSENSAE
jgi:hypothetical protein